MISSAYVNSEVCGGVSHCIDVIVRTFVNDRAEVNVVVSMGVNVSNNVSKRSGVLEWYVVACLLVIMSVYGCKTIYILLERFIACVSVGPALRKKLCARYTVSA